MGADGGVKFLLDPVGGPVVEAVLERECAAGTREAPHDQEGLPGATTATPLHEVEGDPHGSGERRLEVQQQGAATEVAPGESRSRTDVETRLRPDRPGQLLAELLVLHRRGTTDTLGRVNKILDMSARQYQFFDGDEVARTDPGLDQVDLYRLIFDAVLETGR